MDKDYEQRWTEFAKLEEIRKVYEDKILAVMMSLLVFVLRLMEGKVLLLTKYGAGKRTKFSNIAIHNRGGKGMRIFSTTSKTGKLVAVLPVNDEEEFMAISSQGLTVKLKSENISVQGRTARGVRVMNIADNDYIVGVAKSRD